MKFFAIALMIPAASILAPSAFGDRIILRDLSLLADVDVESFDSAGVVLSSGETISWDRIERARINDDRQNAFNESLARWGDPLFRIRMRLVNGDHDELLSVAEALTEELADQRSESSLLVALAVMRGELHAGRRPAALPAYLRVLDSANALGDAAMSELQREMGGLAINRETGLCSQFMPVWFDTPGAQEALPQVDQVLQNMAEPIPPACFLYASSLASAAGDTEKATQWLARIESGNLEIDELKQLSEMRQAMLAGNDDIPAQIERKLDNLLPRNRAVALYWLGTAKIRADDPRVRQEAVLTWLRLPAEYGQYSELAAAGLFYAQQALGQMDNAEGQRSVRQELLSRYPNSFFAQRIRDGASPVAGE